MSSADAPLSPSISSRLCPAPVHQDLEELSPVGSRTVLIFGIPKGESRPFAYFRLLHRFDGVEMRTAAISHLRLLLFEAASRRWTPAMAIPPSPTAAAQRFTEPDRTSPAAKIPGRLVSIGVG